MSKIITKKIGKGEHVVV